MIKYVFQGLFIPFRIIMELLFITPLYLIFAKIMLMSLYQLKKYSSQTDSYFYKIMGDMSWMFKYFVNYE